MVTLSQIDEELQLERFSESSSTKRRKKEERKAAHKARREARAKLKHDDPFSYYFGKVDPDTILK